MHTSQDSLALDQVKSREVLIQQSDYTRKMDGLYIDYYEDNNTNCPNISDSVVKDFRTFSIIGIVLLVPSLILQLFFIYRYKSTFLHRQFLYTTIVVLLIYITNIVHPSTVDVGCPFFPLFVTSLVGYIIYVEIFQITTIHFLLLYKLCKHIETRTTQRLQTLCNIRPRPRHDLMIVCIQLGLPLPILIAEIVMILKTHMNLVNFIDMDIILPVVAVNVLLGLICIVLLMVWFGILIKRKLLKNKAKFVCTQISHILIVLVVLLIGNAAYFYSHFYFNDAFLVEFAMQIVAIVSFGVYILISIPSLQRRVTTKAQVPATNRHTNPPSTRVSLPTDTAEHAPNFLSPSTAEPSEVTPLINIVN